MSALPAHFAREGNLHCTAVEVLERRYEGSPGVWSANKFETLHTQHHASVVRHAE
jgi:hypothetical protein